MAIEKGIQAACHELEALRVIQVLSSATIAAHRRKWLCLFINPDATLSILYLAL